MTLCALAVDSKKNQLLLFRVFSDHNTVGDKNLCCQKKLFITFPCSSSRTFDLEATGNQTEIASKGSD